MKLNIINWYYKHWGISLVQSSAQFVVDCYKEQRRSFNINSEMCSYNLVRY